MEKYLTDKLKEYSSSGALSMHMPGHKRNEARFPWLNGLGCSLDITEIDGFDNLNDPEDMFLELNARAAKVWGAKRSLCLVSGSTGGILAAVRAAMEKGGELLIERGCHKSVYHAAEICGAKVHYLVPPMDGAFGIWGSVPPELVEDELKQNGNIRLVVITSPTYEGVISDIGGISQVCHEYGVPLLVDEAHGAHLGFGAFPKGAVKSGADMVVQSLHKTLPSLTQTALLHINGGLVDEEAVLRNVSMFQSSSPSYLLSSSIDGCVRYMEERGDRVALEWTSALSLFDGVAAELKALKVLCRGADSIENHGFYAFDPSKLVISTAGAGITGKELSDLLRREHGIELEMASKDYVIAMTGMGDSEDSLRRFAGAMLTVDAGLERKTVKKCNNAFTLPECVMSAAAALSSSRQRYSLKDALGHVSAEYVWAYPPGAPVLVPGERVTAQAIEEINALKASGIAVHSTLKQAPDNLFCVEKSY